MSAQGNHGVFWNKVPTSLVSPRESLSAFPVIYGCAPIHRLSAEAQEYVKPGKIGYITGLIDAGSAYGINSGSDDFAHWTLSEATFVYFQMFGVAPVVFVNLFDPTKHKTAVSSESVALSAGKGQLAFPDVIGDLSFQGGPYEEGIDYFFDRVTGEISVFDDGGLASATEVVVSYSYAAPEKVTVDDCIGGYDVVTGTTTGISLIDDVFPKYSQVPTIALAPKFGEDPGVAGVLAAKMMLLNGLFKGGLAVVDLPSDGADAITRYTEAPSYKSQNGLTSESLVVCWPKAKVGAKTVRLSVLAAGRMAATDVDNRGIPYVSPSNKNIFISGLVADGQEVWLDLPKADLLDENGIVSAQQFMATWRLWGNHTAAKSVSDDPIDYFIPCRRMMGWYGNRLVQNYWSKVDSAMTVSFAETIVNTELIYMNGLTASHVIHGGDITFTQADNPVTSLMAGKIKFHVRLGIIPPAQKIEFDVEHDPDYATAIFSAMAA